MWKIGALRVLRDLRVLRKCCLVCSCRQAIFLFVVSYTAIFVGTEEFEGIEDIGDTKNSEGFGGICGIGVMLFGSSL